MKTIDQSKKEFLRKNKITVLPPQDDTKTVDFIENSDWYLKYCDPKLWAIYYHKKEYRKH